MRIGNRKGARTKREKNSRKSFRWSAVPASCLSMLRGEQGSGPKGIDDLCFHTYGEFSPSPPLGSGPLGWDLNLETEIWASRLGYGPVGWGEGDNEGDGGGEGG